jgi:hypothetical protein
MSVEKVQVDYDYLSLAFGISLVLNAIHTRVFPY